MLLNIKRYLSLSYFMTDRKMNLQLCMLFYTAYVVCGMSVGIIVVHIPGNSWFELNTSQYRCILLATGNVEQQLV